VIGASRGIEQSGGDTGGVSGQTSLSLWARLTGGLTKGCVPCGDPDDLHFGQILQPG